MSDIAVDEEFVPAKAVVAHYDDPEAGPGDEGWDIDALTEDVRRYGLRHPIEVGRSETDGRERGDGAAYAFNGNHRLHVVRRLGIAEIRCVHSCADDALPLSRADVAALGGRLSGPADPSP